MKHQDGDEKGKRERIFILKEIFIAAFTINIYFKVKQK